LRKNREAYVATPLNAHCFLDPKWRVIASGFQIEDWSNDGQVVGNGGIANPQQTHLGSGQYLYRFASSASSRDTQLGGGWWLDFENFHLIRTFAGKNGYSVRDAARLMLALPYAWTRVDLLVRALLRVPLKAFTGEGKPARGPDGGPDKGTRWIPTQHIKVRQLYIPGLLTKPEGAMSRILEAAFAGPADMSRLG
jgi:hypothetical protein